MKSDYQINIKRLQNDLIELFQIGYNPETKGVTRLGFTDADMQAKRWLIDRCMKDGLYAYMDSASNVICRESDRQPEKVVATGSHIDSVIDGGMFDGTLGVLAGIECLRVIKENQLDIPIPLEVYAFAEEEGRFGGMMGVQALIGDITPQWLMSAHDVNKVYLKDEMDRCGFPVLGALDAHRDPQYFASYIELHIEQGPVLEKIAKPIGVVESISGVFKWIVRLIGKSNHAGTAPMDMRSDAFMGLVDFAHEIPRIISEEGSDKSRITVGKVELKPGQAHTVPGEAEFTIVGRDVDNDVMKAMAHACRKVCSSIARKHNLMFEFEEMSWLVPQPMAPSLVEQISATAEQMGFDYEVMPSGAGHDAQHMARVTDAGMIFVPSVGGISHAPDEWTHWKDVEQGANLLLHSLIALSHQNKS